MASVEVEVAGRRYSVACRDGEEQHLLSVAAIVDGKAKDAAEALGNLSESRQLLYASLLLADELKERRASTGGEPSPAAAEDDGRVAQQLARIAERAERLAEHLERDPAAP
jgi:cell division protein ZapA